MVWTSGKIKNQHRGKPVICRFSANKKFLEKANKKENEFLMGFILTTR